MKSNSDSYSSNSNRSSMRGDGHRSTSSRSSNSGNASAVGIRKTASEAVMCKSSFQSVTSSGSASATAVSANKKKEGKTTVASASKATVATTTPNLNKSAVKRQSPLLNKIYLYRSLLMHKAVECALRTVEEHSTAHQADFNNSETGSRTCLPQLLLLGAGLDTSYRIYSRNGNERKSEQQKKDEVRELNCRIISVDFKEIIDSRRELLLATANDADDAGSNSSSTGSVAGNRNSINIPLGDNGEEVLVAADLGDSAGLLKALHNTPEFDFQRPTVVVLECVLCYLPSTEKQQALIASLSSALQCALLVIYNPCLSPPPPPSAAPVAPSLPASLFSSASAPTNASSLSVATSHTKSSINPNININNSHLNSTNNNISSRVSGFTAQLEYHFHNRGAPIHYFHSNQRIASSFILPPSRTATICTTHTAEGEVSGADDADCSTRHNIAGGGCGGGELGSWRHVQAYSMNNACAELLHSVERSVAVSSEPFDEYASLATIYNNYALVLASNDSMSTTTTAMEDYSIKPSTLSSSSSSTTSTTTSTATSNDVSSRAVGVRRGASWLQRTIAHAKTLAAKLKTPFVESLYSAYQNELRVTALEKRLQCIERRVTALEESSISVSIDDRDRHSRRSRRSSDNYSNSYSNGNNSISDSTNANHGKEDKTKVTLSQILVRPASSAAESSGRLCEIYREAFDRYTDIKSVQKYVKSAVKQLKALDKTYNTSVTGAMCFEAVRESHSFDHSSSSNSSSYSTSINISDGSDKGPNSVQVMGCIGVKVAMPRGEYLCAAPAAGDGKETAAEKAQEENSCDVSVELSHFCVDESYRCLGVGRLLLRHALSYCKSLLLQLDKNNHTQQHNEQQQQATLLSSDVPVRCIDRINHINNKTAVHVTVLAELIEARRLYASEGFVEKSVDDIGGGCVLHHLVYELHRPTTSTTTTTTNNNNANTSDTEALS